MPAQPKKWMNAEPEKYQDRSELIDVMHAADMPVEASYQNTECIILISPPCS